MLRSDIRLLIVDDDPTIGKAMEQALRRKGYDTRWVKNGEEAEAAFKISDYRLVVIDCMIPRVSGVDLGKRLRALGGKDFFVIFVSGIYRDRQFVRDATNSVNAVTFLQKPFAIEELVKTVDELFENEIDSEMDLLIKAFSQEPIDRRQVITYLRQLESIQAYELAFIYAVLMQTKATGVLTIRESDVPPKSISFYKGKIVEVDIQDKESYFGTLLVERGFTSAEEVEFGLANKRSKRIGETLVDLNSLSPHAIDIIQADQMSIRLSKTLHEASVDIAFEEKEVENSRAFIDSFRFRVMLDDWMTSKFPVDWLKRHYLPKMDELVTPAPGFEHLHLSRHLNTLTQAEDFIDLLSGSHTLNEILESSNLPEEIFFRMIHFLVLDRTIHLTSRTKKVDDDFDGQLRRLNNIWNNMQDQNFFEILGLSSQARSSEINRAYHELAKVLHPDKLSSKAPKELKDLTQKVFSRISEAYDTLKDYDKRTQYTQELRAGLMDNVLKSESMFEKGCQLLDQRRYKEAHEIFDNLLKAKSHRSDTVVYYLWARLKMGIPSTQLENFITTAEKQLASVPPEDRHDAQYFLVKGLYSKLLGDTKKAYTYFKHAVSLEPGFLPAKRELSALIKAKKAAAGRRRERTIVSELTSIFVKRAR